MHPIATNRESLLQIVDGTASELQKLEPSDLAATDVAMASVRADEVSARRDTVVFGLENAARTLRLHAELAQAAQNVTAGMETELPFIPEDQMLSLMQSAIEEYRPEASLAAAIPFDTSDPGWLRIAWEKAKAMLVGKHKFIPHTDADSFRRTLPNQAAVALFSDWGTGEATAQRVMQQIKKQNPTHAIHLGDVYYSGTKDEIQKRFLDIIKADGPDSSTCTYLALNSNHEMYSGGHGYFGLTLPTFGQQASYFNLANSHWQLIGLDSGYEDHGLQEPQRDWLSTQLEKSGPKNILLSHHQLFSPFESRAYKRTLHKKVEPLLGKVFAWFWGHEHRAIVFGKHKGIHARCIGHGAIPEKVPYGTPKFPDVPVLKMDERPGPDGDDMHGFALLRFDGANLDVSYIDELGTTWFSEQLAS